MTYYRARCRLICTSRWRLFRAFLRGRYEEAWGYVPDGQDGWSEWVDA